MDRLVLRRSFLFFPPNRSIADLQCCANTFFSPQVFLAFVTILLLFHVLGFGPRGTMGFLVLRSGMEPTSPAMEGKVLTVNTRKSPIKTQISVSSHMPSSSSPSYFPLQNVLFRVPSEACVGFKAPLPVPCTTRSVAVLSDSCGPRGCKFSSMGPKTAAE